MGVKVTVTVHELPAAMVAPTAQVPSVTLKCAVEPSAMPPITNEAVPALASVKDAAVGTETAPKS